jgi:hypothetical protein
MKGTGGREESGVEEEENNDGAQAGEELQILEGRRNDGSMKKGGMKEGGSSEGGRTKGRVITIDRFWK